MKRLQVGFHIDGDVWEPEQIAALEGHGFDILTTGEHILFFRPILDTVTVLSYAAAVTKKIKLLPSTHDPAASPSDHDGEGADFDRHPVQGAADRVGRDRRRLSARIRGLRRSDD